MIAYMKLIRTVEGGLSMRPRRLFSTTRICQKDEKSKQRLKTLGLSLQKGSLKSKEAQEENESTKNPNSNSDNTEIKRLKTKEVTEKEENYRKLKDLYDSISHMSSYDLQIQKNLDEGKQFGFPSEHYLDRRSLIRNIPDEIDIFNTPMDVIEQTYQDLAKLDDDKSVQLKYFKRYLKKYDDPINNLLQSFNGITQKFKLLRKREMDNLPLSPGAYLYKENLFNNHYNVVGFDRSISGLPLRKGKNKITQLPYPREFIEDLQMFRTKIPIQKRDLDFIEFDDSSVSIDPTKIVDSTNQNNTKDMNLVLKNIYDDLEIPKNSIPIKSIDDYKLLSIRPEIVTRIENEIFYIKKSLQQEIESFMKSNNGNRLLMFNHQDLRYGQFKLCEIDKTDNVNSSLVVINYKLKDFNMLPNFAAIMNTRGQRRKLERHLFKIFLINLEDQIDTLFRIKYSDERSMKRFMKNMTGTIQKIIRFKIIKHFKPIDHPESKSYDALFFKPYSRNSFKRIYWLNNSVKRYNNINGRSSVMVNWALLDNFTDD